MISVDEVRMILFQARAELRGHAQQQREIAKDLEYFETKIKHEATNGYDSFTESRYWEGWMDEVIMVLKNKGFDVNVVDEPHDEVESLGYDTTIYVSW